MAQANFNVTVNQVFKTGRVIKVIGTATIDASPANYTAGGLPIVFTGLQFAVSKAPLHVNIYDDTGFVYSHINGSGPRNGSVKVFGGSTTATPPVHLNEFDPSTNTTAISAALSGAKITVKFEYPVF